MEQTSLAFQISPEFTKEENTVIYDLAFLTSDIPTPFPCRNGDGNAQQCEE